MKMHSQVTLTWLNAEGSPFCSCTQLWIYFWYFVYCQSMHNTLRFHLNLRQTNNSETFILMIVRLQEREEKVRLQAQIKRLWEDNQRLQEESQTSAAKLKKFTEWVFNTIDMNWPPARFSPHMHTHKRIQQHTPGRSLDGEQRWGPTPTRNRAQEQRLVVSLTLNPPTIFYWLQTSGAFFLPTTLNLHLLSFSGWGCR